ncbi:hypothetical protein GCM10009841_19270 [Microlunatus panaciterrae]|uniref:Uncharacterized protein n=1 Tax=Microlunatus panaciterrae TaxID=400768 RepID=A0ABS2RNB4_9ACTN|nr:hypothetical protein [Microlunatus panaciterrae]MBM7800485.1 hypothetical protein [Microlunatus panaciterrae]
MMWVFIFCGIALAGLVMVICYAVWLAHKASDLFSEVTVLAERGGQLADLLAQIEMPEDHSLAGVSQPDHGRGSVVDDVG